MLALDEKVGEQAAPLSLHIEVLHTFARNLLSRGKEEPFTGRFFEHGYIRYIRYIGDIGDNGDKSRST
jgi:hypothetical protein